MQIKRVLNGQGYREISFTIVNCGLMCLSHYNNYVFTNAKYSVTDNGSLYSVIFSSQQNDRFIRMSINSVIEMGWFILAIGLQKQWSSGPDTGYAMKVKGV